MNGFRHGMLRPLSVGRCHFCLRLKEARRRGGRYADELTSLGRVVGSVGTVISDDRDGAFQGCISVLPVFVAHVLPLQMMRQDMRRRSWMMFGHTAHHSFPLLPMLPRLPIPRMRSRSWMMLGHCPPPPPPPCPDLPFRVSISLGSRTRDSFDAFFALSELRPLPSYFPETPTTMRNGANPAAVPPLRELPVRFSTAPPGQLTAAGALGAANLLAVAYLGQLLRAARVSGGYAIPVSAGSSSLSTHSEDNSKCCFSLSRVSYLRDVSSHGSELHAFSWWGRLFCSTRGFLSPAISS